MSLISVAVVGSRLITTLWYEALSITKTPLWGTFEIMYLAFDPVHKICVVHVVVVVTTYGT
jgi:hypothetical protein